MPIHDWTLATAGTYHDFHLKWIAAITDDLNAGKLPPELFAMAEPIAPPATEFSLAAGPNYVRKKSQIVV